MGTVQEPKYDNDLVTLSYLTRLLGVSDAQAQAILNYSKNYGSAPQPPYHVGDTYMENGKIYICTTERLIGEFKQSDWVLVGTDDSLLNNFLTEVYASYNIEIAIQIDGKIETFHQNTDPSADWITDLLKNEHKGDFWYNPTTGIQKKYNKQNTNPVTYAWDAVSIPMALYSTEIGHKNIFIEEPSDYVSGDLWFVNGEGILPTNCVDGDLVMTFSSSATYNAEHWSKFETEMRKITSPDDKYYTTSESDGISAAILETSQAYTQITQQSILNYVGETYTNNDVFQSTLEQTADALKFQISKSGGNNLIKNSPMYKTNDGYLSWRTTFSEQLLSSPLPPENPTTNVTYWYCEMSMGTYERGVIYKWNGTIWEVTNKDKAYFDTLNLADNIIPYDAPDTTESGRKIKIDGKNDYSVEHIFINSEDILLDQNQPTITFSAKAQQFMQSGNGIVGVTFNNTYPTQIDVGGSFVVAYEQYAILSPDNYKELDTIELNMTIPKKETLLKGNYSVTPPSDIVNLWLMPYGPLLFAMKFDGNTWVPYTDNMPVHCLQTNTVMVYRALLQTYYDSGIIFENYACKSAFAFITFYPGFDVQYVASDPVIRPNTYWGETGSTVKRAKYINNEFDSWEDTGYLTVDTINLLPSPPFPVTDAMPIKGYFEVADMKLEYGSSKSAWNLSVGELYAKSTTIDDRGITVQSKDNTMTMSEKDIVAKYGDIETFRIDKDWARFKNLEVEEVVQTGGWVQKGIIVNGNNHFVLYKVGE